MQIAQLKRKVTINLIITGILLVILSGSIFLNFFQKSSLQKSIEKINNETSEIKNKASDLQNKTLELKKYVSLWSSINEKKKNANGIKMDEVNLILSDVASKYSISNPQLKVNLPEPVQGRLFDHNTITVLLTSVVLNFKAANDIKALSFVTDFLNSLNGYKIVTNLEIKKDKDYSIEDLVNISSGKTSGNVSGKIEFFWYVNKIKDFQNNKSSQNITSNKVKDEKQQSM
jgi:hypothetical protein